MKFIMSLGDRIKKYEGVSRHFLCRRMPVMVRVDGRAFHTLTRRFNSPFDDAFMDAMTYAARMVAKDMQGFKAAYVQSDEATFLMTDYDDVNTQGWFDYNLSKIVSLSASIMSVNFNAALEESRSHLHTAHFDSRAFNVPRDDVGNAFLWRMQDWERNSLQMYCQSLFSHKQLHGKNKRHMHDMLHDVGKNWTTDLTDRQRNGTWILRENDTVVARSHVLPLYKSLADIIDPLIQNQ